MTLADEFFVEFRFLNPLRSVAGQIDLNEQIRLDNESSTVPPEANWMTEHAKRAKLKVTFRHPCKAFLNKSSSR
jgi:hypothetical protein